MKKSRFAKSQIVSAIKKHQAGTAFKEITREMGVSESVFCELEPKYGGMETSGVKSI